MRTLKRTLCLVLAMTMVFGFFGIASAKGASEYPDYDDVQYKEALGVMTGIEVIDGMGGKINPTGKVTRAQAAKMVTYAILGADIAKDLPVSASSFDDVNSYYDWAIPSIEYLADKGIVNGRSGRGGHYDPEGEVTAYEFAKMILCAAGYGQNDEYKGDSWALNVAIDARKNGVDLFKGSKAGNMNEAATREECALYCFNGISHVCTVKYNKNTESYDKILDKDNNEITIGSKVYGLALSEKKNDKFMRPATIWTISGKTGPVASTAKTPVATFNDASYATAFADYEFDEKVAIYNNGSTWNVTKDGKDIAGTVEDLKAYKLNGTGIELYNTDTDKDIDAIVMTQAYLAKVTDYTATKGTNYGNFKVEAYNPWAGAKADLPTVTDTKATDDIFDDMVAADLAKDDYLLVYTEGADLGGKIMKIAATKTVTDALTTYSATDNTDGFNGSVTVDDTKYTLASACVENATAGFLSNDATVPTNLQLKDYLTKNVTLFFDEYDMVIGIIPEKVEETVNLVYVAGNYYKKDSDTGYGNSIPTYWVQCVDMDGNEVNYQIAGTDSTPEKTPDENDYLGEPDAISAGLYSVTIAKNDTLKADVATLKSATTNKDGEAVTDGSTYYGKSEASATAEVTSVKIANNNYYSADTTFLFITGAGSDLKVTTATGAQKIPAGKPYSYYSTKAATDLNYTVKYVVVAGTPEVVESESLVFVPKAFNTNSAVPYTDANGNPGIAYKNIAFIDGQPKLDVLVTDTNKAAGFYTYSVDSKTGIYTLTSADKADAVIGGGFVSNVYGNYLTTDNTSEIPNPAAGTTNTFAELAGSKKLPVLTNNAELDNANAGSAKIVDVAYLNDVMTNGSSNLTQITTLNGLVKDATFYNNAVVYYSFTKSATSGNTVDTIYVMSHPAD